MDKAPIFITGLPRSGTNLLAGIIGSHQNIYCGPETQFYNKFFFPPYIYRLLGKKFYFKAIQENLCKVTLADQRILDLFDTSVDELILPSDEVASLSKGKILKRLLDRQLKINNKTRWAEKTPNHLLHLEEIRKDFENARIIRIVRDPRDSSISMTKLPWASDEPIENAKLCGQWLASSRAFFETDKNTLTVMYSDLILDTEATLKTIFEYIEEPFNYNEILSASRNSVTTKMKYGKRILITLYTQIASINSSNVLKVNSTF